MASLKKQVQQLNDGTHPELNRKLKKLEQVYKDRLRYAEAVRNYEVYTQNATRLKMCLFQPTSGKEYLEGNRKMAW